MAGCSEDVVKQVDFSTKQSQELMSKEPFHARFKNSFQIENFERTPAEWGENVTGVKTRFQTDEKEMALTFDACGGDFGSDYDEIMSNHETVEELLGKDMTLFRSGTAYYDEVAVELANTLGYDVVNFDILGDAGATYSAEQVKRALLDAVPGSIALLHMNQPNSDTSEGVKQAIPILQAEGFEFVLLENKTLE